MTIASKLLQVNQIKQDIKQVFIDRGVFAYNGANNIPFYEYYKLVTDYGANITPYTPPTNVDKGVEALLRKNDLVTTKTNLKNALISRGVNMSGVEFSDYADKINSVIFDNLAVPDLTGITPDGDGWYELFKLGAGGGKAFINEKGIWKVDGYVGTAQSRMRGVMLSGEHIVNIEYISGTLTTSGGYMIATYYIGSISRGTRIDTDYTTANPNKVDNLDNVPAVHLFFTGGTYNNFQFRLGVYKTSIPQPYLPPKI